MSIQSGDEKRHGPHVTFVSGRFAVSGLWNGHSEKGCCCQVGLNILWQFANPLALQLLQCLESLVTLNNVLAYSKVIGN